LRPAPSTPVPYTTLFRSLLGRRLGLVARFPLALWHAVDDRARLLLAHRAVRFGDPVGEAVAAEAGQTHQIDVLRVGAVLQMPDRSEEHTSELQSRENLVC